MKTTEERIKIGVKLLKTYKKNLEFTEKKRQEQSQRDYDWFKIDGCIVERRYCLFDVKMCKNKIAEVERILNRLRNEK